MEFKFAVSDIFHSPIVEIGSSLVPPGFSGDRRALWDVVTKISEIINSMGDASAVAQGLTKPITNAERLRNSEQTIYLLVDQNAKNGKGVVTGMLKTGKKSLYVFDRDGHHYQVAPPCVLDFYVHESRQRMGLGKQLFEHMLQKEKIEPVKMAVDRPSDKLLSFLNKHYGLSNALRQMNNYVVFDGFFPEPQNNDMNGEGSQSGSPTKSKQSANGLQQNVGSYGRYGAPRPPCSMGQIIHNQSPVQSNETTGVSLNTLPPATTTVTRSAANMYPYQAPQLQDVSKAQAAAFCQSAPEMHTQNMPHNMNLMQHYQSQQQQPYLNMTPSRVDQYGQSMGHYGQQYQPVDMYRQEQAPLRNLPSLQQQYVQPQAQNFSQPQIDQQSQMLMQHFTQPTTAYGPNLVQPQQHSTAVLQQPTAALQQPTVLQQPHHQLQQFTLPPQQQQIMPQQPQLPQQLSPSQHLQFSHLQQPQQTMSSQQNQPVMQNTLQHSVPTIPSTQYPQMMQSVHSLPALTQVQSYPPYQPQQYVQPPNSEHPVQIKSEQYIPPPVVQAKVEPTAPVPYQYYDSMATTMQNRYTRPLENLQQGNFNFQTQQMPNAEGDMSPVVQKQPEYHHNYQQMATNGTIAPAQQMPNISASMQHQQLQTQNINQKEPISPVPVQDQSGQIFVQNLQSQEQSLSAGPRIASQ